MLSPFSASIIFSLNFHIRNREAILRWFMVANMSNKNFTSCLKVCLMLCWVGGMPHENMKVNKLITSGGCLVNEWKINVHPMEKSSVESIGFIEVSSCNSQLTTPHLEYGCLLANNYPFHEDNSDSIIHNGIFPFLILREGITQIFFLLTQTQHWTLFFFTLLTTVFKKTYEKLWQGKTRVI